LAPMMLIFAILNPLGWLLTALGMVERSLKIAFVFAPLMIASYVLGLPYGPKGVAFAYSGVMILWLVPGTIWAVHGTVISSWDVLRESSRPLASVIPAACLAYGVYLSLAHTASPLQRLLLENVVLFLSYFAVLLFAAGQKSFYLDLLRGLRGDRIKERELESIV